MLKFSDWHNVTILTGMNLALVLGISGNSAGLTAELIEAKIESARSAISACLRLTREMSEEDE